MTGSSATDEESFPEETRRSLQRYRWMAYIVGTGLVILVLVAVPLQYAAGLPQLAQVVGPIHGVMYIVYLLAAADLSRRGYLKVSQLLIIALAGFVPFLAFVVERRITRAVKAELAARSA